MYFLLNKNAYYKRDISQAHGNALVMIGHGQSLPQGKCHLPLFSPGQTVLSIFVFPVCVQAVSVGSNSVAFCLCEDALPYQRQKRIQWPVGIRLRKWFHDGFKPV